MDNQTRIAHYTARPGAGALSPAQQRRVRKHDNRAQRTGTEHVHEPPAQPCLKCHPELRLTDGPVKHDHRPPARRCPSCRPPRRDHAGVPWRPV